MQLLRKWFHNLRVQFIQSKKGCLGLTGTEEQCAGCTAYDSQRTYCNIPQ